MAEIVDRSSSIFAPRTIRSPVLWAWLAVVVLLVACWSVGISPNSDADDLLKLVKIRSYLATGAWFDQQVPGILQPEPFVSHWPRLLDLPYALLAWVLAPLIGAQAGLLTAAFAIPLLLLLPALALYRAIVAALGFQRPDAAFILALIPAMRAFFEFAPDRIDYHNVQIVVLLASIALALSRNSAAALANGAIIALAMATSIEFALFFALVMAIHAVEFVIDDNSGTRRLGLFGAGLAGMALLAYPTVVAPGGAVACDHFSAPHLLAFIFAGVSFVAASVAGRRLASPVVRAALIAVPAVAGIALLVYLFPECLGGPYAGMSAYLHEAWLLEIPQERSLFARPEFVLSPDMVSATLLFIGATAPALVIAFDRFRNRNLIIFASFALLAMAQAILYFRYFRYLPLFAGPGLLLVLAAVLPGLRANGALLAGRFGGGLRAPAVMLEPGLLVTAVFVMFHFVTPAPASAPPAASLAGSCDVDAIGAPAWPSGARIMAPPIIGVTMLPGLSDASVVAVPFHASAPGLERAYRFLDPATADPRMVLDASKATHVAICAWRGAPSAMLEEKYPFAALLMEGKAPDWLVECSIGATMPIRIYRYPAAGGAGEACPTADLESLSSGNDFADYLLAAARANDGVVVLSSFGSKVCVATVGRYAAEKLHNKPVLYEERADSEGFWFISLEKSNYIYVYAISLAKLDWRFRRDVPIREPDRIIINFQETVPIVTFE